MRAFEFEQKNKNSTHIVLTQMDEVRHLRGAMKLCRDGSGYHPDDLGEAIQHTAQS